MLERTLEDDAHLFDLIEDFFRSGFSTDNPLITEAIKRMLAAGGKRLRPRMTLLAAQAGGSDPRAHLPLAAYMELIHVATLIHDDVVDNADTRRGVNATAIDYGNRISVLAGDYLFAWIFKNVTAGYPHPVPNILSSTLADICDGEVLQLRALGDVTLTLPAYTEIVRKKTASLFAASAECGAIMGGSGAKAIDALRDYGTNYGIAFQIRDDVLDVTEASATIGKPAGNDLRERKMTIPLIFALRDAGDEFCHAAERFFDGKDEAQAAVLEGIARFGVEPSLDHAARYTDRAKQDLKSIDEGPAKAELIRLADALASR
ncbi:MAG: polyprenyl synthetase family protein [Candidatus Eremiobacteraeota bacterium]|nr:polyprenyl synthetase family protein [Candidatus Eremiobacteraeota bacterium]